MPALKSKFKHSNNYNTITDNNKSFPKSFGKSMSPLLTAENGLACCMC